MINATLSTDDQAMGRLTADDVSVRCSIYIMTARELTGLTAKLFVQSMCCLNGYVVSSTHKLVPTAVTPASLSAELSLGRGLQVYPMSTYHPFLLFTWYYLWCIPYVDLQISWVCNQQTTYLLRPKAWMTLEQHEQAKRSIFEKHMPKGLFGRSV